MSYYSNRGSRLQKVKKNIPGKPLANPCNQNCWIGSEISVKASSINPKNSNSIKTEWIDQREETKIDIKQQEQTRATIRQELNISRQLAIGKKSAVELMTDILKGVNNGHQSRDYYSQQVEQMLGELLTNKYKLNNFIKTLENDMVGLDSQIVKNYEVLVILLRHVGNSSAEVKQGQQGLEIKFNSGIIRHQAAEIERLRQQKQQHEREIKYITAEYESIISNLNDVIQKLISKGQSHHRLKY